ncbi:MAG: hypothetical protein IB618_01155 [Candidatus Pacearchaeota archaeon]|nr:MAG: hypothetical protein IB618_01155 [Candidatus Pacearchaeota archaeon]
MKKKTKTKKKQTKPKKLKLLPTLREKRHYIVITIEGKSNEDKVKEIINKAILDFIGILGYAKAGPLFVETGKINKKIYFIVSVTTKYVDKVKTSLALIDEKNLVFRCVGVSGTIKKSRRFLS